MPHRERHELDAYDLSESFFKSCYLFYNAFPGDDLDIEVAILQYIPEEHARLTARGRAGASIQLA